MRRYEKGKEIIRKARKKKHNIQKINLVGLHVFIFY
jgi:hypothetical protein